MTPSGHRHWHQCDCAQVAFLRNILCQALSCSSLTSRQTEQVLTKTPVLKFRPVFPVGLLFYTGFSGRMAVQ